MSLWRKTFLVCVLALMTTIASAQPAKHDEVESPEGALRQFGSGPAPIATGTTPKESPAEMRESLIKSLNDARIRGQGTRQLSLTGIDAQLLDKLATIAGLAGVDQLRRNILRSGEAWIDTLYTTLERDRVNFQEFPEATQFYLSASELRIVNDVIQHELSARR